LKERLSQRKFNGFQGFLDDLGLFSEVLLFLALGL